MILNRCGSTIHASNSSIYHPTVNTNWIYNAQLGIVTDLSDHAYVANNNVYLSPIQSGGNAWAGYFSWADKNATVGSNTFDLTSGHTGMLSLPYTANGNINTKLVGMQVIYQGANNILLCNIIKNMHWAINVSNSSITQLNLNSNWMDSSRVGAVISDDGYIGCVGCLTGSGDNAWLSCTSQLGVMTANGGNQLWLLRTPPGLPSSIFPTTILQVAYPTPTLSPYFNIFHNYSTAPYTDCGASPLKSLSSTPYSSLLDSAALGTVQYAAYQSDNLATGQEQLVQLVQEYPDLMDSDAIIPNFIDSNAGAAFEQLQIVNYNMKAEPITNPLILNEIKASNADITPATTRDQNMKTINDLYMQYFVIVPDTFYQTDSLMTASDLATLAGIASQCPVTGGPAVIQARSMYQIATNGLATFADNCRTERELGITNGSDSIVTEAKWTTYIFKVFPNPLDQEKSLNILSSEAGNIIFYNTLGQIIFTSNIDSGTSQFTCAQLKCESQLIFYKATLCSGKVETGKIVSIM